MHVSALSRFIIPALLYFIQLTNALEDIPDEPLYTITGTRVPPSSTPIPTTFTIPFPKSTQIAASGKWPSTLGVETGPRKCNGYEELCGRSYGNVTFAAAHNSAFVREGNLAANQNRRVYDQLRDGVRMCKCLFF